MCFFITIAVPVRLADQVRAQAGRDFNIEPTSNPSAVRAAGPGFQPLLLTSGGCSCGWYTRLDPAQSEDHARRARERYEKRGWSRAKIERALASMERPPRPDDGLHPVVVELMGRIVWEIGECRLWVHDFSGKAETEAYTTQQREPCTPLDLAEQRARVALDEVWCVRA